MSRYAPVRSQPKVPRVDREKTCPSLLRVFVNPLHHHPDSAFTINSVPTSKEYQVYVWRDSTMREIILSLRDAAPHLRGNNAAKFSLKLVFWDSKLDRFASTDLALVNSKDLGSSSSSNSSESRRSGGGGGGGSSLDKTLSDAKYVVGDFVDIAYILPGVPNPVSSSASNQHSTNGPQFAPVGAQNGSRGGLGGFGVRGVAAAAGGPRGGPRGGDTWAPTRSVPGGPSLRGGPVGGRNGSGGGRPAPADQGWGNRRPPRANASEGRNVANGARPPRRDSRSLSPDQTRPSRQRHRSRSPSRSRSRSRSPRPVQVRSHSRSASPAPKNSKRNLDRSASPQDRRATPPHMKGASGGKEAEDEDMRD